MIRAICDAASEGKVESVKKLLRADPLLATARDEDGWTPTLKAAFYDQEMTASVLLRAGAPPNDVDNDTYGCTALHWAAERNNVQLILTLASRPDTDMNLQDRTGYTPLHRACMWGNLSSVMALVLSGADPRLESSQGETAEALADDSPCIRCFLKASRRVLSCWRPSAPSKKPAACKPKGSFPLAKGLTFPARAGSPSTYTYTSSSDDDEEDGDCETSSYQRLLSGPAAGNSGRRSVASMFVCADKMDTEMVKQPTRGGHSPKNAEGKAGKKAMGAKKAPGSGAKAARRPELL